MPFTISAQLSNLFHSGVHLGHPCCVTIVGFTGSYELVVAMIAAGLQQARLTGVGLSLMRLFACWQGRGCRRQKIGAHGMVVGDRLSKLAAVVFAASSQSPDIGCWVFQGERCR